MKRITTQSIKQDLALDSSIRRKLEKLYNEWFKRAKGKEKDIRGKILQWVNSPFGRNSNNAVDFMWTVHSEKFHS